MFVGRQKERTTIIDAVLSRTPVIALGIGGVGKTALAINSLHDHRVRHAFRLRYFVSCDKMTNLEELRLEIAQALAIPVNQRYEGLAPQILLALQREPSILVLDNFETLFNQLELRMEMESELETYAGIKTVALVVTMRGAEVPASSSVPWKRLSLQALSLQEAEYLFNNVAGLPHDPRDEFVQKLAKAVDCLPLAVTLLAHRANPRAGTTYNLWKRWKRERLGILARLEDARNKRCDVSVTIEPSIRSLIKSLHNRPLDLEAAVTVMASLAQLPNGLAHADRSNSCNAP
ncbi:hypothetical protein IEO21_10058 [Rhodonia placenta]|uniref:NB-ARC domain-containing protein n=1 Tax=Rhodonia placenta TaxID=104341 RepID=A0A8H7TXN2_9APHY|nr:hypothetical protein IEO21_10058 [Postia placenta]